MGCLQQHSLFRYRVSYPAFAVNKDDACIHVLRSSNVCGLHVSFGCGSPYVRFPPPNLGLGNTPEMLCCTLSPAYSQRSVSMQHSAACSHPAVSARFLLGSAPAGTFPAVCQDLSRSARAAQRRHPQSAIPDAHAPCPNPPLPPSASQTPPKP